MARYLICINKLHNILKKCINGHRRSKSRTTKIMKCSYFASTEGSFATVVSLATMLFVVYICASEQGEDVVLAVVWLRSEEGQDSEKHSLDVGGQRRTLCDPS